MNETHIEHLLESLDASARRPIKTTLRTRLLAQYGEQSRRSTHRLRLAAGLALSLLVVLALAASPAGGALAQEAVVNIVQVFRLGGQTTFTSVEGDFTVTELEDGEPQITPLSDEDVAAWAEPEPVAQEVSESLEVYIRPGDLADVPGLQVPAYVPDGLVFSTGYKDGDEGAVDYVGAQGELLSIRQVQGRGIHVTSSSDIPVEEITISGHPATLSRPSDFEVHLLWVAGDTSYELMANGISVDEALKVAESLP